MASVHSADYKGYWIYTHATSGNPAGPYVAHYVIHERDGVFPVAIETLAGVTYPDNRAAWNAAEAEGKRHVDRILAGKS